MATDFSDIGFDVNSEEDVYDLAFNNQEKMKYFDCPPFMFSILELDSNSWFFYYGDEEGLDATGCELIYKNMRITEGENWGWTEMSENQVDGIIKIFCDGDISFPLNVVIPDALSYKDEELGERIRINLTLFAQEMDVYENFEAYDEASGEKKLDGCIPYGTFPLPGHEKDFIPSAHALMSGRVLAVETRTNDYTGKEYLFITFDCTGHEFDIVADPEYAPNGIKEGNFIHGSFWISGLLHHSDTR